MTNNLSIFNWSLRKALDTEPDSFIKARIRIIYTIILFSLLKAIIVIGISFGNEQWLQAVRAVIAFVFYMAMLKVLLYVPSRLKLLAHIMMQLGILVIWTNIFVYAHTLNLITVQFIFMIVLSSFYTLGGRAGIVYSLIGILPVLIFLVSQGNINLYLTNSAQVLASPGPEILVVLNFISIIVTHFLFFNAFHINLREKEKLNEQLQLSIAEANKLATSKSNFLSTMSHELRTPLNAVVGITELLLDDKPSERQKENLKILQQSSRDLLSLINNVLDINKIDSDKLVLESVPVRLAEYVRDTCSGLKMKAVDKGLDCRLDIDEQLENITVISDPTRISQLIYNLVGNAIKFTDKGSITFSLKCLNKTERGADILFSIEDTGIGIPADKHESIFEVFTQAEIHTTRKYGGTGLGLAIVKQVLALFNSSLQLESTEGKGSKFFFTIPFTITAEVSQAPAPNRKADLSHLKILVAEDNELNRLLMQKQLDKLGISTLIVENGKLAYDAYLAGQYDAIFMDLHMPVLDGYEATKQIRSITDNTKANVYIIAFTASVTEQQEISEAGFDDFLYKPVNMNDLHDKLEKVALQKQGSMPEGK